jgi:hypothetical protein
MPTQINVIEIKRFLGAMGFYNDIIFEILLIKQH